MFSSRAHFLVWLSIPAQNTVATAIVIVMLAILITTDLR